MTLVTQNSTVLLTGALQSLFDLVSRDIVIFKEPAKTLINNNNVDIYDGYSNTSKEANYIFTPVSGIFNAQIISKPESSNLLGELEIRQFKGDIKIKCQEDCRQFIKNGKNEYILVDTIAYNGISQESVQNYLGLNFYYFSLSRTL